MITRFWLAPRRRDMSIEASQAHWRSVHGAIGRELPGLRRYVQNHGLVRDGRYLLPYPGFDICSELTWDDLAAMDAAIDAPRHARDSLDDERNFADPDRSGLCLTERRVRIDGQTGDGTVKLMTFLRRHPRASNHDLADALSGPYAAAVAAGSPLRHEQFRGLAEAHRTRGPAAFDAIDAIWLASAEDALRYLASRESAEATWRLAGRVLGTERFLVRPEPVLEPGTGEHVRHDLRPPGPEGAPP